MKFLLPVRTCGVGRQADDVGKLLLREDAVHLLILLTELLRRGVALIRPRDESRFFRHESKHIVLQDGSDPRNLTVIEPGRYNINQKLREDGYDVSPPQHSHGYTFYVKAPGGFTVEVLC